MAMGAPAADWQLYLSALRGKAPSGQTQGNVTHG